MWTQCDVTLWYDTVTSTVWCGQHDKDIVRTCGVDTTITAAVDTGQCDDM